MSKELDGEAPISQAAARAMKAALEETSSMLAVVAAQLQARGYTPLVNADGGCERARAALALAAGETDHG